MKGEKDKNSAKEILGVSLIALGPIAGGYLGLAAMKIAENIGINDVLPRLFIGLSLLLLGTVSGGIIASQFMDGSEKK